MRTNLFDHPDYGSDLKRLFENEQNDELTRATLQDHLSEIVQESAASGFMQVDHERKRIDMPGMDQDMLTMALTQCPVGTEYEVLHRGRLIGKATYRGITSEDSIVSINSDFSPDESLEYTNVTSKLGE